MMVGSWRFLSIVLDDVLDQPPTFVKMDIEGAELDALAEQPKRSAMPSEACSFNLPQGRRFLAYTENGDFDPKRL